MGKSRRNKSALNSALSLLSRRPYSQKEVFDHLIRHWPETDTLAAINKLKELKFIDDKEFAGWYTQSRLRSRPMSQRLIALELKRKGLEIRNLKLEISEPELAQNALSKKKNLSYKQAMRFLASRGFSWDTIETVLKKGYNNDNVNY